MQQPTYHTEIKNIGYIEVTFRGEQWESNSITDTEVLINNELLCCISWNDKESFASELNATINKYKI